MAAQFIFLVVVLLAMYLLLIRPQQMRVKKHQAFVHSLAVGDEVVTAGGMVGTISGLDDAHVIIRSPGGVELSFVRAAVSHRATEEEAT